MKRGILLSVFAIAAVSVFFTSCSRKGATSSAARTPAPDVNNRFEAFTDSIGIRFIPIRGGIAMIGSYDGKSSEGPPFKAKVNDFFLAETELTVAQWTKYFNINKGHKWGLWEQVQRYAPEKDCPALCLSKTDGDEMCKFLCRYIGATYRLPTEEELEYVTRIGESEKYFDNKKFATIKANFPYSHPVKSLKPNKLGLYGLLDNVWEWTSSEYAPYPSTKADDPLFKQIAFVLRCGGLGYPCSPWTRNPSGREIKNYSYGLRLVRER